MSASPPVVVSWEGQHLELSLEDVPSGIAALRKLVMGCFHAATSVDLSVGLLCFEYDWDSSTVTIRDDAQLACWLKYCAVSAPHLHAVVKECTVRLTSSGAELDTTAGRGTSQVDETSRVEEVSRVEEGNVRQRVENKHTAVDADGDDTDLVPAARKVRVRVPEINKVLIIEVVPERDINLFTLRELVAKKAKKFFVNPSEVRLSFTVAVEEGAQPLTENTLRDERDVRRLVASQRSYGFGAVALVARTASAESIPNSVAPQVPKPSAVGSAGEVQYGVFLFVFNPPRVSVLGTIDDAELGAVEDLLVNHCVSERKRAVMKQLPSFEPVEGVKGVHAPDEPCYSISFPTLFFDELQQDDLLIRVADVMEQSGKYKLFVGDAVVEVERNLHEMGKLAQRIALNPSKVSSSTRTPFKQYIRMYFRHN